MITLVEASNFRCLRCISGPLSDFHVLVGPNASGKTTFLDVVKFLGDLVSGGIEKAVGDRTANFQDLTWQRKGGSIELAVEAKIPPELRAKLKKPELDTVRYEVALGPDPESEEIQLLAETVSLRTAAATPPAQLEIFPRERMQQKILLGTRVKGMRVVVNKVRGGNDNFYPETYSEKGKGWVSAFKVGPRHLALTYLPPEEPKFPVAIWLKNLLLKGIHPLVLNSLLIRKASPPGQSRAFQLDGSNLPWVVAALEGEAPERFIEWIAHLRTALPDLEAIRTIEQPDDKKRYLMLRYRGGFEVPSWMVSDGTLRLLALTLPAYLPETWGIYLIEEPENGIHPRAIEAMFQSLSSVYGAQILLATHSPVVLSLAEPKQLLCFAKAKEGATDIVRGSEHPALAEWRGEVNLSVLFAAGVLGYGE